mmetsp:Transcript_79477/g.170337  ORF Transcript_79477/g.170337 Transcript_79477/m.170337 type:complete len:384 (+) Transcript_79477:78-1229(+)
MGRGGYGTSSGKGFGKGKGKGKGKFDVSENSALAVLQPRGFLQPSSFDFEATLGSVTLLSNYVWDTSDGSPKIRIQTLPKAYISGQGEMTLTADQAPFVVYEDHIHLPTDPTAPINLAVRAVNPDFNFRDVDAVLDGNTLRKLWGFDRGDCSATATLTDGVRDPSFMLRVDSVGVGEPIIYERVEPHDRVPAPPNVFGNAFADAVAKPVDGAYEEMFYSIMMVQLGAMKLLVRSEVDACEYDKTGPPVGMVNEHGRGQGFFGGSTLEYVLQGAQFKGTLVELKTKRDKYKRDIDWNAISMQMLFSGARKLVLGLQEQGWFYEPKEYTFEEVCQKADRRSLDRDLARLEQILHEIAAVVQRSGGSLDLFCGGEKGKPLVMRARA